MRQLLGLLLNGLDQPVSVASPRMEAHDSPEGVDLAAKLSFEATVAQMSRGFENTQRVIQFMDAKAGAVIALCLGIFILTGKLVVGVYDRLGEGMLTSHHAPVNFMIWGMTAIVVGVGLTGFISLHFAFGAVKPNGLPQPEHFTTLFPAAKKPWEQPDLTNYMGRAVAGENQHFVLDEFRRQLLALGDIVFRKINCLKTAIFFLWWQGLFSFLLLVFIGVVVGFGLYPKKADLPPKPFPVTILPAGSIQGANP
ncbi:hypothetical protein JIN84_08965 [Luteolibacter yonseiensis]|uniref:Pycsar effector protein domain-containing protein n=2 Tax=Luteolibacter yonseiensis TaxID=1144680 RepID=A0A934R3R5_9BACT|nr:hypothetical protein [Luteolibacter yonseiensis]